MNKGRLEAFSDGVIAIIITIMVLEIKVPHSGEVNALGPLVPLFVSYVLSFAIIAIYWNNHHHLLQAAHRVNGSILWANMHLLFWLTLTPFVTGWMGVNHFAKWTIALYGIVQFFAAIAYYLLAHALLAHHGSDSRLGRAIGSDRKGKVSVAIFGAAIPMAFVNPWIAFSLYIAVTVMWLIPDRRIEKILAEESEKRS